MKSNRVPDLTPPTLPTIRTAADILATDYGEQSWVIPGIIMEGLTILGGAPKAGKSYFGLQVAHGFALGGTVLGHTLPAGDHRVIYLALEDGERRLQSRMREQGWAPTRNVCFLTACAEPELRALIASFKPHLLIIDTLARFFGIADQNRNADVTNALGPVQALASATGISILVIDHHHKKATGDPVTDVAGSIGKGAVADTLIGFYREPQSRTAVLKITGRDVEPSEIPISWDDATYCWELVEPRGPGKYDAAILDFLATQEATFPQILQGVHGNKSTVYYALNRFREDGTVAFHPSTKLYSRCK